MVRYVFNASTYRRIDTNPLDHTNTGEFLQRKRQNERLLRKTARLIERKARFGTTTSRGKPQNQSSITIPPLTHLTSTGAAHMVDIGAKNETHRSATAVAYLFFAKPVTYQALTSATLKKGDALAVARIAGIQAAKRTADLIPLAHPNLGITAVTVDVEPFPANNSSPNQHENHVDEAGSRNPTSQPQSKLDLAEPRSAHGGVRTIATVNCHGKTGVEMEALTAANIATLTMYDMLKGVDKGLLMSGSRVIEKKGGKSGSWKWDRHARRIVKVDDPCEEQPPSVATLNVDQPQKMTPATKPDAPWMPLPTPVPSSFDPLSTENGTSSTDTNSKDEESAQSIFESEWSTLTTSFSSLNPPSSSSDSIDTNPPPSSTNDLDPDLDPDLNPNVDVDTNTTNQEWQPYNTTTSNNPPTKPETRKDEIDNDMTLHSLRDTLSGPSYMQPDSEGFLQARKERYEEWKRQQ